MKHLFILITIILISVSCRSQTKKYSVEEIKMQNELLLKKFDSKTALKSKLYVKDVLKALKFPVTSFYPPDFEDSEENKSLSLNFFNDTNFDKLNQDNLLKFYKIKIILKETPNQEEVTSIARKANLKWTQEIEDYFKNLEITEVVTNDK